MQIPKNLYDEIVSLKNLIFAYKKARKGKTKKDYVKKFEEDLAYNLKILHDELDTQIYKPKPLKTFILRDPKTRKISKADFRDRIVHHAICNILEPIFDKTFIYDNCANRKCKGTLFAIERFDKFKRRVTNNLTKEAFCFKADIKHYFQKINHKILLEIIKRKIKDERVIWLIEKILDNNIESNPSGTGMPLGNLTSQFFANVYLNELDRFVKNKLKVKYYIRYVDDFVLLNSSKEELASWGGASDFVVESNLKLSITRARSRGAIDSFLNKNLKLELHPDKSRIINLSKGIDFVGFRNFYHHRLLRKRNIKNMKRKIELYKKGEFSSEKFFEILEGWNAYAKWANSYKLREKMTIKLPTTFAGRNSKRSTNPFY